MSIFTGLLATAPTKLMDPSSAPKRARFIRVVTLISASVLLVLSLIIPQARPAQTTLATVAASLQPGHWVELPTNGITRNLVSPSGNLSNETALAYANHAVWDPVNKEFLFFGSEHIQATDCRGMVSTTFEDVCAGVSNVFLRYQDSTNAWSTFPQNGHTAGHAYDHNALDSATGDFYLRQYPHTYSLTYGFQGVHKWTRATQTWSHLPIPSDSILQEKSTFTGGLTWFPELGGVVECLGALGQVAWYNGRSWVSIWQGGPGVMGGADNIAEYDPVHKIVVFGGGASAGSQIYSLTAALARTQLASCPVRCASDGQNLIGVDPVSGKLLLFIAGSSWELNLGIPGASWAQLPSTANAPFAIGHSAMTPVITYGVMMAIDASTNPPRVWLYKHTLGTPDAQAPTVPANVNATVVSASEIDLTWIPSTDNIGVAGYAVYRGTSPIATVAGTSYQDMGLSAGTPYSYNVTAFDAAGNFSAHSASVAATTLSLTPDTSAPSVPTGLTAMAISSAQINLVWNPSSDNIGVSGYQIYRDGGFIARTTLPYYSSTGLNSNTPYTFQVLAVDAAANQSPPCNPVTAQTLSPGQQPTFTFSQLCAQPGVLKCVGFDSNADIPVGTHWFQPYQSFGQPYGLEYPINDGTPPFSAVPPAVDSLLYSSGAGSLKFTIPSQSPANSSGDWFINFSPQIGPGGEFYVFWKQRFSSEFLNIHFTNSDGFKQLAVGEGDHANCNPLAPQTIDSGGGCAVSHSPQNIVIENIGQLGIPRMYHHSDETINFEQLIGNDYALQNARPTPGCFYGALYRTPRNYGSCFRYYPDEWMTFELHVKVDTWFNGGRDAWNAATAKRRDSQVELWGAREGQPLEYIMSFTHWDLINNDQAHYGQYGKVWILPYQTNKDPNQVHPTAFTWYDDLIISTRPIGLLPSPPASPINATKR